MSAVSTTTTTSASDALTATVRERYGNAALRVVDNHDTAASCCGPVNSCCGGDAFAGTVDPITSNLYATGQTDELPAAAVLASLGCGNPTALAELQAGEIVLDLGSGGGIDVLLSARRVGPTGKAYGLDMTDEMLALARRNQSEAGVTNVEFLKGQIEAIPLPDASVDVIISNCVVNLSGDKAQVLREAFRVLKPGGRFAVSDVVVQGELPPELKRSMELWVGCVAGALEDAEFVRLLRDAGFEDPSIEMTRTYDMEDARAARSTSTPALARKARRCRVRPRDEARRASSRAVRRVLRPDVLRVSAARPFRVLVLCTGNSARSQFGEALFATRGAGRVVAASAGSHPAARVNPHAIDVLRARGIAWHGRTPKSLDDVAGELFDLVITVCDNARDACPVVPGAAASAHWGLPDPAELDEPSAARVAFAATYDALATRVDALLALPLETMDAAALATAAQRIHDERVFTPA